MMIIVTPMKDLPPEAPEEVFDTLLLPARCRRSVIRTDPAHPTV